MRSYTSLLPLLLAVAGSVIAAEDGRLHARAPLPTFASKPILKRGHGFKHDGNVDLSDANSTDAQCHELSGLQALTDIANNATKLDRVSRHNATRASEIEAEASSAAPRLQSLQSNMTLIAACQGIAAVDSDDRACAQLKQFERLQNITANSTELARVTKNNATRAAELQAEASREAPLLAAMEANATLTQFCSVLASETDCHRIAKLEADLALSQNQTALEDKFGGNETAISAFQAHVTKGAQVLARLQNNATLTAFCATLNGSSSAAAATTSTAGSAAAATSTRPPVATGGAATVQPVMGITVALVALFVTGVFFL